MAEVLQGRYVVYGFVAEEHENDGFTARKVSEQHRNDAKPVYATDDRFEAKRLVGVEGGFIRDGKWVVCTGAIDTETDGILGFVPAED